MGNHRISNQGSNQAILLKEIGTPAVRQTAQIKFAIDRLKLLMAGIRVAHTSKSQAFFRKKTHEKHSYGLDFIFWLF